MPKSKFAFWFLTTSVGIVLTGAVAWATSMTVANAEQSRQISVLEEKSRSQEKQLDKIYDTLIRLEGKVDKINGK